MSDDGLKDEEDALVTLSDVEDKLDEDLHIIYGGCDYEPFCTYIQGYVKRQAVYVCNTCTQEGDEPAGICFHCSVYCHGEHEIQEIYTKRDFRCDCGNSKFSGKAPCTLWEEKDDQNELNMYNHNFRGLYCECKEPYPQYDTDEREMFQCCLCEDWFHLEHVQLSATHTLMNENDEFTCNACLKKHCFLLAYVMTAESKSEDATPAKKARAECKLKQALEYLNVNDTDLRWSQAQFNIVYSMDNEDVKSTFWPADWRETVLCHCSQCTNLYKSCNLTFLVDKEDTLAHYTVVAERRIKEMNEEKEKSFNEALANLPRSVAVDFVSSMNAFKNAFQSLLREKENSDDDVIREADIKKMFEKLNKRFQD